MSFSNIVVCLTFISLNFFFRVLAPILTVLEEVSYDSLEGTCLATTYKLLTLKLLHLPIPKQNLYCLSSRTDPFRASHYLTHLRYPGHWVWQQKEVQASLTLGSLACVHDAQRAPHLYRKFGLSHVIPHSYTFWEMNENELSTRRRSRWLDRFHARWGAGNSTRQRLLLPLSGTQCQLSTAGH